MQHAPPTDLIKQAASFSVALVVSLFNHKITQALLDGTMTQLLKCGVNKEDIKVFEVPGAVEIPLVAKRLASQKKADSIIALGAVIRGETSHYELVCDAVSQGCMRVSLDYDIPVIFGVLTTENEEQAWDRLGGRYGHKGVELANCAISMHELLKEV